MSTNASWPGAATILRMIMIFSLTVAIHVELPTVVLQGRERGAGDRSVEIGR